MNFGDKLKQYRLREGLSQEQLAEKIGVSRQAITKWETKRGLPGVELYKNNMFRLLGKPGMEEE